MSAPSKQKEKAPEVIDATGDVESDDDQSGSDAEVEGDTNVDALQAPSTSASQKKKKKKKSKAKKVLDALRGKDEIPKEVVEQVLDKVKAEGGVGVADANIDNVRQALQQMKIMDVAQGKAGIGGFNKKDMGEHKFWSTQPVPQLGEGPPTEDGFIEPSKPREEVRQEPYPLPKDFEWSTLDIKDPAQNKEVYDLLSLNYIEDDQAAFRFQYTAEFLTWALTPPGYHKEWHVGVRVSSNKKLVAFISGVPLTLRVRKHVILLSEINYLCVHKKLRSKRLAPVLIKEVTRQCHLQGVFQAIYTAGIVIPTPVSVCRYHHRLLNIPKLVDTHFCYVPRHMTLARMVRVNKLATSTVLPGLREMREEDVTAVAELYSKYMQRFDMAPVFDIDEVRHQFLSGMGRGEIGSAGPGRRQGQVTWAYVVEDPNTKKITDFFSFYSLPSTVIGNINNPILDAAYLFYYASETGLQGEGPAQDENLKQRLLLLIGDALIVANEAKFDVFNALTLMDNIPILQDLKFGLGDGFLNFYLYNWRTSPLAGMNSEGDVAAGRGIGVVML
ncbi:Glycylpeptide N-tetradecanoyltransferase [Psilocybe cubensis]|uniref:Glycylpeptide N-tetradecanoyltransferase n=2 Tax=Psilocybe cubensis TaxID=181762 RepID=A0ACB8H8V2_PSICU|nr:Glycylpeptide N-tetradecanoyltransferase [Psilocybe cubensis]KAH9483926.1 Glycylpeptide N-tetradecanoyltransferase [Psilocybe cubensis]